MPVSPTYPGVYIEEIPSGVRPVVGVATSIAAFIGPFRKGPADAAVQIFSMADFEREYGGLERNSEATYGIQQFFVNGGTEAWVVRVAHDGSGPGTPTAAATSNTTPTNQPQLAGTGIVNVRAGRRVRGQSFLSPGGWGDNLRIEVDYNTDDPTSTFNLGISEVRTDGDRTTVLQTEVFRNLTMVADTPNNAIEVVNQGSRLVQLDRTGLPALPAAPDNRPAATGTLGGSLQGVALPADGAAFNVTYQIQASPAVTVNGTLQFNGAAIASHVQLRPVIEQAIRRAAQDAGVPDAQKPLLAGATVQLIGAGTAANPYRYYVQAGRGARPFNPRTTLTFGGAGATAARLAGGTVSANFQQLPLGGGTDGTLPVPATVIQGSRAAKTGLYALEDVDLFNILCIPDVQALSDSDVRAVYTEAEAYAEERRAMLIVDIPADVRTLDHIQAWLTENESLRHPNAALYYPRVNVPDRLNQNRPRSLAASGTLAGLWARTDAQRGVWKAPAGTEARLRGVESLDYRLTDQQNGALNPLGVNCLRNFPVYANICWGARTLEGADVIASDWKYLPVRRTTLFIEESLFRGTKWVVFEPNDEPLWAQIRLNIGAFMQDLFRQGAFQGTTPREAYFVKCDSETTTQTDIDNGIVNIEVGFAPLKPAEFVIIRIQQIARRPEA